MPTTFVPHLRLSLIGTLPDDEVFSCNLGMIQEGLTVQEFIDAVIDFMAPGDTVADNNFTDLVADCVAFWARPASGISPSAVLKMVKLAPIAANGTYLGPPREAVVNQAGAENANQMFPFQVARKVTLETDGDLGRVKGGFYLPGVTSNGYDPSTNLASATVTAGVRDSVQTFINNLNDRAGLDATGSLRVVIPSQGRNRNGVQTVPPTNWVVQRVNVGRRYDVQRRRANALSEARISDADVS